ncbi:hypothetical protein MUK42_27559 [Musa troglodytarum]|uniref:Uncharacterized protein n=1 Tax=Musa troglodytarum TaxID=320322 RepID=A0A9E7GMP1_9LILI|nr:hypothetical protein MUK42_27559 [Musa troglodytarum]
MIPSASRRRLHRPATSTPPTSSRPPTGLADRLGLKDSLCLEQQGLTSHFSVLVQRLRLNLRANRELPSGLVVLR